MATNDPWSIDEPETAKKKPDAKKKSGRSLPPWVFPIVFAVGVVGLFGVLLFVFFRGSDTPEAPSAAGVPTTNPAITYVEDDHDHEAEEAAAASTSAAFDEHELESPEEAGLPAGPPADLYPTGAVEAPEEGYEHDHAEDEGAWRSVVDGFGAAYGNTDAGPEAWLEGLRPYLTDDLIGALTGSGDFDGGVPKSVTVVTDGGITFQDVEIRYDNSSLDLRIEVLNEGERWVVTSIDRAQ